MKDRGIFDASDEGLDRALRRALSDAAALGPEPDDEARIEAAVGRTLASLGTSPRSRRRRARGALVLLAAALSLGALAYAAGRSERPPSSEPRAEAPAPPEGARAAEPAIMASVETWTAAPDEEPAATEPTEGVAAEALPSVSRRSPARAAQPPARTTESEAALLGPAELFARANAARRANDSARAIELYRELQTRYPGSREASTSRVALGRLLLDRQDDPVRARSLFNEYLARDPSGPLAEEARVGRALACMRLGDRDAERAAWSELLERHPDSVHAERARRRLVALGN